MSSISNAITQKSYFQHLPEEILREIVEAIPFNSLYNAQPFNRTDQYFSDPSNAKAILKTASLCSSVRRLPLMQELKNESLSYLKEVKEVTHLISSRFPNSVQQLFDRCGLSIDKLPVLRVHKKFIHNQIEHLEVQDLAPYSIMKFIDSSDRAGIAFRIGGKTSDTYPSTVFSGLVTEQDEPITARVADIECVLCILEHRRNNNEICFTVEGYLERLGEVWQYFHDQKVIHNPDETCAYCATDRGGDSVENVIPDLERIIKDQDRYFKIGDPAPLDEETKSNDA